MAKYRGTYDALKAAVAEIRSDGSWTEEAGLHRFKSAEGEILNWWPKSGAVNFQGNSSEGFEAELLSFIDPPKNTLDFGDDE